MLFITTANVLHTIPWALQDRMEIIKLSGYTELEKKIKKYLIPKQLENNGLSENNAPITEKALDSNPKIYKGSYKNFRKRMVVFAGKLQRKLLRTGKTSLK